MPNSFKENVFSLSENYMIWFATVVIFFFFNCNSVNEIDYFSTPEIDQYNIYCSLDSLEYIYKNSEQNTYISIQIIHKKDTAKAKMRIRGDSSRKDAKKSLKVKFFSRMNKKVLNFNAEFSDKSYVRQYLSSKIMRTSGQNCFDTKFTRLFINGEYFGLYLQVENMDNDFLKSTFVSESENLYKATKDGACMSIFDNVEEKWEQKIKKDGWEDLKELINELNTVPDSLYLKFIKSRFNYIDFVNILALNIYLANGSTYYHNYYLFHHENGKWELLPWDMDKSLSYYDWMPYKYHRTSSEWESDNPLIEKAFLNPHILSDVKSRIKKLNKTLLSTKTINPLINSLEKVLWEAVKGDTTDQIKNVNEWRDYLEKERNFFKTRCNIIFSQFNKWPSSFAVKRIEQKVCDEILFEWTSSKSPRNKKINYILSISSDFLFKDSLKLITRETSDTLFLLQEKLPQGKYYWKVSATDEEFIVDGFNSKNVFEKVVCSILKSSISKNETLRKNESPFLLNETLTIEKNAILFIENGVEIRIDTGVNILVHGKLFANGTKNNHIVFCPKQKTKEWGCFYFFNGTGSFNFTKVIEGKINSKYTDLSFNNSSINIKKKRLVFGINRNPIIWTHYGSFLLENSTIEGNGTGEGINTNFSKSVVRNSTFINLPDAVEYICVKDGIIENCTIKDSPDDAIDMNACHNILVKNNFIENTIDKAISIGKEQYGYSSNILLEGNNLISNNIGIAVKDSSFAIIKNNSFVKNHTAIYLYKKDISSIGGIAEINNNIFSNNIREIHVDSFSKVKAAINIADKKLPFGKTIFEK
mgnify:CR=1 FL=1